MKFIASRKLARSTILVLIITAISSAAFAASAWSATLKARIPPTISGSPLTTIQVGNYYQFAPVATDPDTRRLYFSISNKPSWASFNTSTGRLSGTPATVRAYSNIVIRVSDGRSSASLPAFTINVTGLLNGIPVIGGTPVTSATVGVAYVFAPGASDPEGQALTFSIANRPAWASFNTGTGRLSGTPTAVGTHSNIVITVTDGANSASLAAFAINVVAAANRAPTISGTPASTVTAGSAYSFTPSASDADNDTLAFSITGKPSWATFSTANGRLNGTPTTAQAGTYLSIVISVSDGKASAALPSFAITVSQPAPSGTANLIWTAPTQNTDGSALTDLAGYRVYHGTSPTALTQIIQVPGAGITTYVFNQLASGTHYFAVAAFNSRGAESELSSIGSKSIP